MSSISFHSCNNCHFRSKRSGGYPYYTDQNTNKLVFPMVPIKEPEEMIEGRKYTEFCSKCFKSVQVLIPKDMPEEAVRCPLCSNQNTFIRHGSDCPSCKPGRIRLERPKVFF